MVRASLCEDQVHKRRAPPSKMYLNIPSIPKELNPVRGSVPYIGPRGERMFYPYRNSRSASASKDRQNSWKIRLSFEAQKWKYMCMLTYTFQDGDLPFQGLMYLETHALKAASSLLDYTLDEVLPDSWKVDSTHIIRPIYSLNRRLFVNYVKRVRDRYNYENENPLDICYFLCGEYGPTTYRPHAHLLCYFNDPKVVEYFEDPEIWGFGSIDNSVDHHSNPGLLRYVPTTFAGSVANYISKYVAKCSSFDHPLLKNEEFELALPFANMSKGIGANWLESKDCKQLIDRFKSILTPGVIAKTFTSPNLNTWPSRYVNSLCVQLNAIRIPCKDEKSGKVFNYKIPRYYLHKMLYLHETLKYYGYDKNECSLLPASESRQRKRAALALAERFGRVRYVPTSVNSSEKENAFSFKKVFVSRYKHSDLSGARALILSQGHVNRSAQRLVSFKERVTYMLLDKTKGYWPFFPEFVNYGLISQDTFISSVASIFLASEDSHLSNAREAATWEAANTFLQNSCY